MRTRSFRVRIALLSVLCSSLVLLGSALFAGHMVWESELNRADAFCSSFVRQELAIPVPPKPPMRNRGRGAFGPGEDFGPDNDFGRGGGRRSHGPRDVPPDELGNNDFGRAPGGPEGGPNDWGEPPWRRGPMGWRDDILSQPLSFYYTRDNVNSFERRSTNWPASLTVASLLTTTDSRVVCTTIVAGGKRWRVASGANAQRSAVFGVDLAPSIDMVKQVASALLLSIPVALALIAVGAIFMARRALRPVDELARLVERITASGLGERIKSPVRDAEFEKLIRTFNQMMDRLERSFTQANRFSADAAHELRTPLSILQGYIERMINIAEPGSDMQQQLGEMVDEIHRIKSILEKLLLLARMDAGQIRLNMEPLDLGTMVQDVVDDIQVLAPAVTVRSEIQSGLRVQADSALLETAIRNLAGNAVKYNWESDGRILVTLAGVQGEAVLTVANTGPRIHPDDYERIFERFYRADKARSRDVDGLGLGLSLAREIVQAHHGRLELADGHDDLNRFVLRLTLI